MAPIQNSFTVILLFASTRFMESHILRLSCKLFGNFSAMYSNRALHAGFAFKTLEHVSTEECKLECMKNNACKSINTIKTDAICQLNNRSVEDQNDNVSTVEKEGWTYYSTMYNETQVGQNCKEHNPCPIERTCFDSCECPGYICKQMMVIASHKPGTTATTLMITSSEEIMTTTVIPLQEQMPDCEVGTLVQKSTSSFQSCYLLCKGQGSKAMSFEISSRDCYCGNSLTTKASTGFKCTFIAPAGVSWEANCTFNTNINYSEGKSKWLCFYYCKEINVSHAEWRNDKCYCINAGSKSQIFQQENVLMLRFEHVKESSGEYILARKRSCL